MTDDLRAKILAVYGIDEDDPDWVALNTGNYAAAEDAARASYDHFRNVVLPARIARFEAEMSATLPDDFTVKFEEEKP